MSQMWKVLTGVPGTGWNLMGDPEQEGAEREGCFYGDHEGLFLALQLMLLIFEW